MKSKKSALKNIAKIQDVTKKNHKKTPNLPQTPDHPQRILIIGGSGSCKVNSLFNLIS